MPTALPSAKEWTEWHLTLRGWVPGMGASDQAETFPEDRVLTYQCLMTQDSAYSNTRCSLKLVWCCNDHDLIKELIHKYGDCLHQAEAAA